MFTKIIFNIGILLILGVDSIKGIDNVYTQYGALGLLLSILVFYWYTSLKDNIRRDKQQETQIKKLQDDHKEQIKLMIDSHTAVVKEITENFTKVIDTQLSVNGELNKEWLNHLKEQHKN